MHRPPLQQNSFLALLVLVTLGFFVLLKPFYAPIFWACAVAVIFYPMQQRLLAKWPNRPTLMALVTLLVCTVMVVIPVLLVAASFITEGLSVYQKLQEGRLDPSEYIATFREGFPLAYHWLERFGVDFSNLGDQVLAGLKSAGQFLGKRALAVGQNTFRFFIDLGLMLYLTFFLLRDGNKLIQMLIRALPLGDDRERMLFNKFAEITRATIKGNLVVAAIQGALGGLIFWFLGIPAAVLWGVVMAVLSLLPAVGAGLIWGPVAIYYLTQGEFVPALVLTAYGIIVIGLADNLLRPILVGKSVKLPDYVILIATIGGLVLFGINGFVIGPMIAALFISAWSLFADAREQQGFVHEQVTEDIPEADQKVDHGGELLLTGERNGPNKL